MIADVIAAIRASGLGPMLDEICAEHNVSAEEVCGTRRHKQISAARQHLWSLVREEQGLSFPAIGRLFGRNHTTVMAGIQRHARSGWKPRTTIVAVVPERAACDDISERYLRAIVRAAVPYDPEPLFSRALRSGRTIKIREVA
jgi:hypothetical protein